MKNKMHNLHPVLLICLSMVVKLQPIVPGNTIVSQNGTDHLNLTVMELTYSLKNKGISSSLNAFSLKIWWKKVILSSLHTVAELIFIFFLFTFIIMLFEMEMLLSLVVSRLVLLVGMMLTPPPTYPDNTSFALLTLTYWMLHTVLLTSSYTGVLNNNNKNPIIIMIYGYRRASKCKMTCYFSILFLYKHWVGQKSFFLGLIKNLEQTKLA